MSDLSYNKSLVKELLIALIPYTRQNTLLVFSPNRFFNELERSSGYAKDRLRTTYYRAKRKKLLTFDNGTLTLALKGQQSIQPFIASKLLYGAKLMVIFDIPEEHAGKRQRFRSLLKQLDFKQIQLSVWMSDMDYRQILFESIEDIEIQQWVQLYESLRLI